MNDFQHSRGRGSQPSGSINMGETKVAFYNSYLGICQEPEVLSCEPPQEEVVGIQDQYVSLNSSLMTQSLAATSNRQVNRIHGANPLQSMALPFTLTACSQDAAGASGLSGLPIASISPVTDEAVVNAGPILGKVRQVAFTMNEDPNSTIVWSVSDFINPEAHGTYAVTASGSDLGSQQKVSDSPQGIPRDTSVARLANGQSVMVYSIIQGDAAPSEVVAQKLDETGNPTGPEISVLPEGVRTGFPAGQVVSLNDGFIVVYRDGEGELGLAEFDDSGVEVNRISLGEEPLAFRISRGEGNEWILAEITEGNQIKVRNFTGSESGGVETTVNANILPASPDISVAMQPDGAVMVAWNALDSGNDPLLEGAFLDGEGNQVGEILTLRNLIQGSGFDSEDHINSHHITTDHNGNFILAFEENRNLIAYVYNGNHRDEHSLTDISSTEIPSSGEYADALAGLSNLAVQNVEVDVEASGDGSLAFVYTKIMTGEDADLGETVTVQQITRRDYQITYE